MLLHNCKKCNYIIVFREKILDGFEFKKHIDKAAELNPRLELAINWQENSSSQR